MNDELHNDLDGELQPGESIEEITPEMMSAEDQLEIMGDIFHTAEPMMEELGRLFQSKDQLTTEQIGEMQQLQEALVQLGQQIKNFDKITSESEFQDELDGQKDLMRDQGLETGSKELDESLALLMATYHVQPLPSPFEAVNPGADIEVQTESLEQSVFENTYGVSKELESVDLGPLVETPFEDKYDILYEGPDHTIIAELKPEYKEPSVDIDTSQALEEGIRIDYAGPNGTIIGELSQEFLDELKANDKELEVHEGIHIEYEGPDGTIIGEVTPEFRRALEDLEMPDGWEDGIKIDYQGPDGTVHGQISPEFQEMLDNLVTSKK